MLDGLVGVDAADKGAAGEERQERRPAPRRLAILPQNARFRPRVLNQRVDDVILLRAQSKFQRRGA